MKKSFIILSALLLSLATYAADIGKPAPDFTGTDINGQTIKLADYKGKIIVIESFNPDCPFDRNHYQGAAQELQKELTDKGVVWLLVNSVSPKNSSHRTAAKAQQEWKDLKISATAWLDDSDGAIGHLYGMKTTPHVFVIGKDGTLVYDGAMDDLAQPFGDPRTAKNYVRTAVQNLLANQPVEIPKTKPYGCAVHY
jgi:peroxiredoxin